MRSRLVYILPLAVFLIIGTYFAIGLTLNPHDLPSVMVDKPAPAVNLPALNQAKPTVTTESLKGQVTLVNFWASWCAPCRAEHPLLTALSKRSDVVLAGIAYKDRPQDSMAFLTELGDPFDLIGMDADGRTAIEFGVYGVPETYVIDKAGHIRYRHAGALTRADVDEVILPMIAELSK